MTFRNTISQHKWPKVSSNGWSSIFVSKPMLTLICTRHGVSAPMAWCDGVHCPHSVSREMLHCACGLKWMCHLFYLERKNHSAFSPSIRLDLASEWKKKNLLINAWNWIKWPITSCAERCPLQFAVHKRVRIYAFSETSFQSQNRYEQKTKPNRNDICAHSRERTHFTKRISASSHVFG